MQRGVRADLESWSAAQANEAAYSMGGRCCSAVATLLSLAAASRSEAWSASLLASLEVTLRAILLRASQDFAQMASGSNS